MNIVGKKGVRYGLIALMIAVLISISLFSPISNAQTEDTQGKVDILFDGEDVGNHTEFYMTDGREVNYSFTTSGNISLDKNATISWNFTGDGFTKYEVSDNYTHTYNETDRTYNVTLRVETEGRTYEDRLQVKIKNDDRGKFLTTIGAGLAVGIAGMGAGIGVGIAGAAGAGTIAEKPDKFGKCLVYSVLPQTQAIYGLLIAVLLLLFTGSIGGEAVPLTMGVTSIGIGLAVGIAGLSAIGQGIAASGSIAAYSEKEELFGKGMVFSVLPETQAIYGLLVGILLMVFTGLLGGNTGNLEIGLSMVAVGAGLAVGVAGLSGIGQGIAAGAGIGSVVERDDLFGKNMVFSVLPETQAIYGMLIAILLMVFTGLLGAGGQFPSGISGQSLGLVAIGAGFAVGIAGLSGIGQGIAAASGIGSIAENDQMFGKGMVFSVLPETQAIYGMLIAILLMIFSGIFGEAGTMEYALGLVGIGAGLSVGVAGLSGIGQGIAAASGIATVSEDESMFGKGMVFSVLPETQAIYGMLIAILLMVFSPLLGSGSITMWMGVAAVGAGLAIGISGVSGVGQGITSGSAISAVSKNESTFGQGMIFSVMSETFAIFGLLIAILIIISLGFMG